MKHKSFKVGLALGALLSILCMSATAQQPTKIPRIGVLSPTTPLIDHIVAFRQGLRELGYVEGKNIVIEHRYAEGKENRLAELLAELVRLEVDVIITPGTRATQAAKKATQTVPIVMTQAGDPVAVGLVASLARPGGNITGWTQLPPQLSGKRLELLKDAFR